jgi:ankyrin repeat protein
MAASCGIMDVAQQLLAGGADPSLARSDGVTPLMAAALHGHLEVCRVDTLCPVQFWSAKCLRWPIVTRNDAPRQVLCLLLARGAEIDAVGPPGGAPDGTAFHAACSQNHPDCVEALVRRRRPPPSLLTHQTHTKFSTSALDFQ